MKKYFSFIGIIALAGLMPSCKKNDPSALSGSRPSNNNTWIAAQPKKPELVSFKTAMGTATTYDCVQRGMTFKIKLLHFEIVF